MSEAMLSAERQAAAFLAAAAAPALVAAFLSFPIGGGGLAVFVVAFVIALLHVLVLAWPFYLMIGARYRLSWWNVLIASFLVGATPALLLEISLPGPSDMDLFGQAVLPLAFGGFGLSGGLAFWAMLNLPARPGSCR